jgi:poly-gamma-glutamate synthesis protein (capsule biosynthesis protein)
MIEARSELCAMLAGDVMLGRGIDQIMEHPSPPALHEPFIRSALDYVRLAERRIGCPLPRHVLPAYVWGDALEVLAGADADVRVVNLETAVTRSEDAERKGINYRMNPANIACLKAARVDCCALANNHVLDWGHAGLLETLASLADAGIATAGAGRDSQQAAAPAILPVPGKGRVLVFALAFPSSGVPLHWAAKSGRPGLSLLRDTSKAAAEYVTSCIAYYRRDGDMVVVSIHWGANWGYDIAGGDRQFAERLIEQAGADVVYGHSSHHPKAIAFHRGKPILFGCGDFINDYEGISGHEAYRPHLVLLYRLRLGLNGVVSTLELLPFRIARFRLERATREETNWLGKRLDRECRRFGARVAATKERLFVEEAWR